MRRVHAIPSIPPQFAHTYIVVHAWIISRPANVCVNHAPLEVIIIRGVDTVVEKWITCGRV